MALPTIGDYLTGQQTINPFAAQALAQATQGANLQAAAQQEAALSQLAMQPNVVQQTTRPEVASTGGEATQGMANVRQPRFNNLGFSQLNALASLTPQASFSPTEVPGGAYAQGLTNLFNIREQRQARNDVMGLMQQQQAAAQQAAQQKAAAAQQAAQQQLQGLASLGYSPDIAAGIVASGQGGQVLGQLQGLAKNYADIQGILQRQQTAQRIDPSITNVQQTMPQSPINAAVVRELLPKFNQFGGIKEASEAREAASKAAVAPMAQALDIEGKKQDVQSKTIANQFAPLEEARKQQEANIKRLEAEGKLEEAAKERGALTNQQAFISEMMPLLPSMSPTERQQARAMAARLGITDTDWLEVPKTEVKKIGKNDYGVVFPDGTVQRIDLDKLDMAGTPSPVTGVIPQQPTVQQPVNIAPTQPQPVAQVLKSRQLRTQLQQAKPGSQKQKDLIKQIREAEAAEGSQRRSERFTPIQGGSFNLQVPEQVLMVPSLAPTEMSF